MRTPINLETTVFDLATVVATLEDDDTRFLTVESKGKRSKMLDFGSIICGFPACHWSVQWFLKESPATVNTFFSIPEGWRMPQVLKALGAFKSAGEAKRNGWDKDVPDGWSQHICRIGHVRGVFHILKLTNACPTCGAMMTQDVVGHECET